jgi:hypothetical protein
MLSGRSQDMDHLFKTAGDGGAGANLTRIYDITANEPVNALDMVHLYWN